jgi:hypothetical protein
MALPLRRSSRTVPASASSPVAPLDLAVQPTEDEAQGLGMPPRGPLRLVALRFQGPSDRPKAGPSVRKLPDAFEGGLFGLVPNKPPGFRPESEWRASVGESSPLGFQPSPCS